MDSKKKPEVASGVLCDPNQVFDPTNRRMEESIYDLLVTHLCYNRREKNWFAKSRSTSETTPDGLTIAHVELTYRKPEVAKTDPPETRKFTGPPADTLLKSQNVAARAAIKHIEKVFDFELVDINHEEMVYWRKKHLKMKEKLENLQKEHRSLLEEYVARLKIQKVEVSE